MAIDNRYNSGHNATVGANTVVHYYDKAGIKNANLINIYTQFASKETIPTHTGKTYKVSKFLHPYDRDLSSTDFSSKGYISSRNIDDVTAGLVGSILPEGAGNINKRTIKKITMETTLSAYAQMIEYTDEVLLFSEDSMQVKYREELGLLANLQFEDLVQTDMLSTTTVLYSGTATSLATVGTGVDVNGTQDDLFKISYDYIRRCAQKLTRNRAKKNTSIIKGSTTVMSQPVNSSFYCIIGNEVKFDLESITKGTGSALEMAFLPIYKYGNNENTAEGEVGAMHDVRFIESETAVVYEGKGASIPGGYKGTLANNGAKFNVYPILFPTEGSFSTVTLKGENKIIFYDKSPEKLDSANTYGNQGYFSYKFRYAGIIAQDEKLLKGLVGASK
ncbi:MAG: N4-gp56 family major capsid protein [Chlamydiia bacterium]|nr:N4-gp56 family major capsid protein [Chlamydiia bacterium]